MKDLLTSNRKFKMVNVWGVVATGLLYLEKLPAETYVTLMVFLLGGYLGANVIQKATAKPNVDQTP